MQHRLTAKQADLGTVTVRRVFPVVGCKMIGPWVFFDHMGPVTFAAGEGLNVPPHPHIGLATVTYLFAGEILHRDSLGTEQAIRPGAINLMVAGRGVTHSERETAEAKQAARDLHGLQLWLALPEASEQCEPAFHHIAAEQIPNVEVNGVAVRVLIGEAYQQRSPVPTFSPTLYLEAQLQAGQTLTLPDAQELGVYVVEGELEITRDSQTERYHAHQMAVLRDLDQSAVTLNSLGGCLLAIVGGDNLGQRHIHWNFVASQRDMISQARDDWQAGHFPSVPGDPGEPVPLPE